MAPFFVNFNKFYLSSIDFSYKNSYICNTIIQKIIIKSR